MAEIATCRGCGKLYNYVIGQRLCPMCQKAMDTKFKEVKKYVYENPKCSVHEVAEAMEVNVRQINQWIREEKLSFAEDSAIAISCEKCGATIRTGRFCDSCKGALASGFRQAAAPMKPKKEGMPDEGKKLQKMRFLDS